MTTLNWLTDAASRAMDALLARLDLDRGARPYFWVDYQTQPPRAHHSYWDTCDIAGRFVDGLVLARIMTGRQDAQEAESMLRRLLWAQQDESDGLFYSSDDEQPAANAEMSKYIPAAGVLTSGRHIDLFCQRAPMLAMTTLLQLGDEMMRPRLEKMVRGLASIAVREGDEAYFPAYRWAQTMRPEWFAPVNVPEKWQGYRYALLTALARYAEVSHDPAAIDLALGLARYYMRHGDVPPDGRYRANTHSGGVLPATVGIARLGVAFGQPELIEWAKRVYEWTRENMPEFGFLPDGLGMEGFWAGTCETCALADFIHLAVLLSESGAGDYWDDVERVARNQLLENQYRDVDAIRCIFPGIADDVLAMLHGGFECAAHPNDLFTYVGAEGCCIGGGIRALYLAWRAAIETRSGATRVRSGETQVRFGISRTTSTVEVTGFEPWAGRIDVKALQPQRVAIRLPAYANMGDAGMFVDGQQVPARIVDRYAIFELLDADQTASLQYPMPHVQRNYHIAGKDYEADWLGNTVITMRPDGVRHPVYRRREWLESQPVVGLSGQVVHLPVLW